MGEASVNDTLVFIPAWNEEGNLPAVLDELQRELPGVDVLVVDDGSTDRTAEIAREQAPRCCRSARTAACGRRSPPGTATRAEHGYAYCGRVDADGQHPVEELRPPARRRARGETRRRRRARASRPGERLPRGSLRALAPRAGSEPTLLRRSMAVVLGPAVPRRDERHVSPSTRARCRSSPGRTRAAPRRSRRCSACTTRAFASTRCPSTCGSERAASRSSRARRRSCSCSP